MARPAIFLGIAFVGGLLFFFLYHQWLVISFVVPDRVSSHAPDGVTASQKKVVPVWYWDRHKQHEVQEQQEFFWSTDPLMNGEVLIRKWLTFLEEEGLLQRACAVQTVAISVSQELFISFDRTPFHSQSSTYDKLMLIESLFKTIRDHLPVTSVRCLVDHEPLDDPHLDFSSAWGFDEKRGLDTNLSASHVKSCVIKTILIHPAGSAQDTGRVLNDTFERAIALECAQKLKKVLTDSYPALHVILTRDVGDRISSVHAAEFANRLPADLCLSLHFFYTAREECPLYFYYFSHDSVTDAWYKPETVLDLIPYQQAYKRSYASSKAWAHYVADAAKRYTDHSSGRTFKVAGVFGIPVKPLAGFVIPALMCEIGIKEHSDLEKIVPRLAQGLSELIRKGEIKV